MSSLSAPEIHETDDLAPDGAVEVHRNAALAAAVGVVAAGVGIAYLGRALGGGSWLDVAIALAMGLLAAAYLTTLVDARTPLLVADAHGVRIRLGRTWRGVPWHDIDCVEIEPRRGLLRDGRLILVADDPDVLVSDLDGAGRRQVALARRLHGSPFAIVLGLSTRVTGAGDDLGAALVRLAGDPDRVVELVPDDVYQDEIEPEIEDVDAVGPDVEPEPVPEPEDEPEDELEDEVEDELGEHPVLPDPRPTLARGIDRLAGLLRRPAAPAEAEVEVEAGEEAAGTEATGEIEPEHPRPIVASATPLPLRETVTGTRAEVRFEGAAALRLDPVDEDDRTGPLLPEAAELRPTFDDLAETSTWQPDWAEESAEPVADPVIGPQLAAARARLHLTVDQLAERTRIRPHVIESIEVDDFVPCGGDFYARGHLRTLARVLGVDAGPLLAAYDERYADAPIDARRVFEAELATGPDGPIRSTRGGPNWSILVAAVMALVLAWSIARLVMDSPVSLDSKPVLNGSPSQKADLGPAVPVLLDAADGGTHVVVRDGAGEVVFTGDLAYGQKKAIKATPPVAIQSSDGALQVTVDGSKRGPIGAEGQPAQNTYAATQ